MWCTNKKEYILQTKNMDVFRLYGGLSFIDDEKSHQINLDNGAAVRQSRHFVAISPTTENRTASRLVTEIDKLRSTTLCSDSRRLLQREKTVHFL